ncbi:uncharacterized protein LOC115676178 [Syzygium oleosum]|uniref:uncharacterized protein LOC115676178 n=1 Tax=Syzygium oleosum TaxID=219896 RepID=UPI0011D265C6|nr:uncharacterized protein LOC115676178 [Syzygium oleosum]
MGRLSYDPQIQHFSHPHTLQLSNLQSNNPHHHHHHHRRRQQPTVCSACHHPLSSGGPWIYSCPPCGFAVHASCAQLPPLIAHPSHPKHPLSLLPSPAYPSGSFNCDACGRRAATSFSYHCGECHFDLHVGCASKPLSVTHRLHPHALGLAFYPPYVARGFSCDVCRGAGAYHWLYRCGLCEFDAHLDCATGAVAQPSSPQPRSQLQHYNSVPAATNSHWHQYPNQTAPPITGPTTQPGPPNHIMHCYSMGAVPNSQLPPPPPPAEARGNNSLMGSAWQTFINSAADQAAQTLVQEMLGSTSGGNSSGNDGSGYCGNGGGGDSSSTSILGVGSSILSAVFGGSSDSQDQ